MNKLLVAALSVLISTNAGAQDCGGMVNVGGLCIPPEQESSPLHDTYGGDGYESGPAIPRIEWADSWGAIADDGKGTAGAVTDFPSKRKARAAAIRECISRGGDGCVVKAEYKNQCAAIVDGDSGSNIVNAATVEVAIEIGMRSCHERNDSNCHVYYSGCSVARRIR